MRFRVYKMIFNFLKITLLTFLALGLIFFTNGFYEKALVNKKIEDFKNRAVFIGKDEIRENVYYYKVIKEYDYEDVSRNTFDINTRIIGSKTDIIITNRNPMRGVTFVEHLVDFLSKNFFVGHATINSTDDGSKMIEVLGNASIPENNRVVESYNDWMYIEDTLKQDSESPIIIGLRIKNTTSSIRDEIIDYAKMQIGKGYNYSFVFNRHKTFYCTDLVSRSIKQAGINVNYDYFATTGNDMIVSNNTYIFFLRETVIVDGQKIFNVYFLETELGE